MENNTYLYISLIKKGELDMARPIKDARHFEERMKHPRKETKEQREERLKDYEYFIKTLKK